MAKNRTITRLACESCNNRNYTVVVTKKRKPGSLKLKKFCRYCRAHGMHKEVK